MILIDEKTEGVTKVGKQLSVQAINGSDDVTFKASFIVLSDLYCEGKVTALFDLFVVGDIKAKDLDIKGRLVCLGSCSVDGAIIVQNDIWAEDIEADSVFCHDRIVAQSIDATQISAEGSIVVGKTLAVEDRAQSNQSIICGETAFGAGKLIATEIITAEPLDLDDGEEALEKPYQYNPKKLSAPPVTITSDISAFSATNNYKGLLEKLTTVPDERIKGKYQKYLKVLNTVSDAFPEKISTLTDASLLIWLIEIMNDNYFKNWTTIIQWGEAVKDHFTDMAEGIFSSNQPPRPADKLLKGYVVSHAKYGEGNVTDIVDTNDNSKATQMAIIDFLQYGVKKFPIPNSLKFFEIISERAITSKEDVKQIIECNVDSYSEWVTALESINRNKDYLGSNLYEIIYERLLSMIGLKAKFVEDRFKEKGWS